MNHRFLLSVAVLAGASFLLACGDEGEDVASLPANPTPAQCADAIVTALNSLDVSDIDPDDGLDDDERATVEDRMTEVEDKYPYVKDGGACADFLDEGDAPEVTAALIERVDPKVVAVLGAEANQKFEKVGESIDDVTTTTG